jgi:hypothetical protein
VEAELVIGSDVEGVSPVDFPFQPELFVGDAL